MTESEYTAQAVEADRVRLRQLIASYEAGCREITDLHADAKRSIARLDRMRDRLIRWTWICMVLSGLQLGLALTRIAGWY